MVGCVNHEFDIDCSSMPEHQAGRVSPHVGLKTLWNVAEKQAPFAAVQIKRGARRYRYFQWRADTRAMACHMKKPSAARNRNVRTKEIFDFRTMVYDRHVGARAVRIRLWHHDGGMNDFQMANAVGMRLCGARGE
jgi:hypothetical protein